MRGQRQRLGVVQVLRQVDRALKQTYRRGHVAVEEPEETANWSANSLSCGSSADPGWTPIRASSAPASRSVVSQAASAAAARTRRDRAVTSPLAGSRRLLDRGPDQRMAEVETAVPDGHQTGPLGVVEGLARCAEHRCRKDRGEPPDPFGRREEQHRTRLFGKPAGPLGKHSLHHLGQRQP